MYIHHIMKQDPSKQTTNDTKTFTSTYMKSDSDKFNKVIATKAAIL